MSEHITCFLFLISLSLVIVHGVTVHGFPITSCSQLPYPQACRSFLQSHNLTNLGFRELIIQAAMEHANRTLLKALSTDLGKLDPRTRAAWEDCLALVEDTIDELQHSLTSPSNDDSQTWLSAAFADQQTCLDGFHDFNLSSSLSSLPLRFMYHSNISETLSNTLAINKASMPTSSDGNNNRRLLSDEGKFPEWLSVADRKLCQSSAVEADPDLVVAKDGSGDYKTIKDAVAASKSMRSGDKRFIIHVKAGVYSENVEIKKSMTNIMFIGDGIDQTVVTGSKNVEDGTTTFKSATFATVGKGFIARDMTFENTAGPEKHQAVALRSGADRSVFYRCSFKGYQDTLYVHSQRQFYRECDVYGTIDFIFGDAVAVLQDCNIFVRRPMSKQKNTVTAQGRSDRNENTGISIHNSRVTAASDLRPVQGSFQTFLGRPWKKYSRTVFMKSDLDGLIAPAGWLEWDGDFALSTLYYGEYMNTGDGAGTSQRVEWSGYRVITSASEAGRFTVGTFLDGDSWLPATDVPFTSGL